MQQTINFVFLSCHFPHRFRFFVRSMKNQGVRVLGVGDEVYENLNPELTANLQEYYKVSNLENYDDLHRCLGYFVHKYGRIHFIESLNEHWLESEARLREDFNVQGGYRPSTIAMYKRKSGMKKVYQAAGLKCAPGALPKSYAEALEFTSKVGFPVIMKPDNGVGAANTRKINSEAELTQYWDEKSAGNIFLEQWIQGGIETYDGLCDHEGNIVFYSSMKYSGLMEVVSGLNDSMFFCVSKDVPDDLKEMGDISVKAFEVRSQFFHCEFFRTAAGDLLPLEINLRPPGVITLDVMNFTYRTDLYTEYANVISKRPVTPYKPATHYGCYAARRDKWNYVYSNDEVAQKIGNKLELSYAMPKVYSAAMGDFAFVFTTKDTDEMRQTVQLIEQRITRTLSFSETNGGLGNK